MLISIPFHFQILIATGLFIIFIGILNYTEYIMCYNKDKEQLYNLLMKMKEDSQPGQSIPENHTQDSSEFEALSRIATCCVPKQVSTSAQDKVDSMNSVVGCPKEMIPLIDLSTSNVNSSTSLSNQCRNIIQDPIIVIDHLSV